MRGLTDEEREVFESIVHEYRDCEAPTEAHIAGAMRMIGDGRIAKLDCESAPYGIVLAVTPLGRLAYACDTAARSGGLP